MRVQVDEVFSNLHGFIRRVEANFTIHPDTQKYASRIKLVRYQENPTANWGPGTKAVSGTGPAGGAKRKHAEVKEDEEED